MKTLSHRRKWYTGFTLFVLIIIAIMLMLNVHYAWILLLLSALTLLGLYDFFQKSHSLLRNFPILGHLRYIFEFFRPEIQQYFIADDKSEMPFDRETRTIVYERSKALNDTIAFGTERDIYAIGYEWVSHSLSPKNVADVSSRIIIGGDQCTQPYSASRLNVSAMSYGALSKNAIAALNKGAKIAGCYHNTGEGGFTSYHEHGADVTFQIGTGYFGVRDAKGFFSDEKFQTIAKKSHVKMIEIKLSQGAKPAHGGVLPKEKITPEIASIRHVSMDKDVLSPPAHTAFNSPETLCHFIQNLRTLSDGKPIGFKLCVGRKSEFLGICKAMLETKILPDFITVDGAEGGTGAAPLEYSNHIGMPLNDALIFIHNALTGCGLRDKIKIIVSGKVATGFDMITKLGLGADVCNAARAMMLSIGCIQSRQCNENTCPTGVATQNPRLYRALNINLKAQRMANFHRATIHSFLEIVGAMGLSDPSKLKPHRILRRVSASQIKSYDDIYDYLKPHALLNIEDCSREWQKLWHLASAQYFYSTEN